jgi:hypothetical protein
MFSALVLYQLKEEVCQQISTKKNGIGLVINHRSLSISVYDLFSSKMNCEINKKYLHFFETHVISVHKLSRLAHYFITKPM